MKIYRIDLEGHDVKSGCGLMNAVCQSRLNTLPNTLVLRFSRLKLEATHTPVVGDDVYVQLTNGNGTPVNYYAFYGYVAQIEKEYRFSTLTCLSYGQELTRLTETGSGWSTSDVADVMKYVIETGSTMTQQRSGMVSNSVTGFTCGDQYKTDILRRLCEMSYKSGSHNPFVFYESGQTAKYIRCEPFGVDGSQTLTVGTHILGRPQWADYAQELCNDVTVKYNGGETNVTDSTSISTYGRRKGKLFVYNVDNATDATLLANTFLWEWKDIRYKMGCYINWKYINDPSFSYPVLNKAFTINDTPAGKSSISMVCNYWKWEWPSFKMYLEFGTIPFLTSDMYKELDARVIDVQKFYDLKIAMASDNLQHSHNATATTNSGTMVKKKTMTFPNGIPGSYRVKFDMVNGGSSDTAYGEIYKNGAAYGTMQDNPTTSYVTYSQDFGGPLVAGDTLELWCMDDSGYTMGVKNFRVYYSGTTMAEVNS